MLPHTDRQAANDIDDQDQDAGDRIPAHELRGTVHRTIEIRLAPDLLAARTRLGLINQAGVQVGIDRHLLAGHGVQGEACRHLRYAACALGDDREVDDHEDREHHQADCIVTADHELAECLDHLAGRITTIVAFQKHHPRRRDVQRQAQQRRDQQHRRKHCKIERPKCIHSYQQHHQRQCDVEGEEQVKQERRQWQDHHRQQHQDHDGGTQPSCTDLAERHQYLLHHTFPLAKITRAELVAPTAMVIGRTRS